MRLAVRDISWPHEPKELTHVPPVEAQSEPMEDDELEMDVDDDAGAEEDAEAEDADDIDVVGDGTHDDEAVVDDKDVVEEDVEDELLDVRVLSHVSSHRHSLQC